MNSTVFVWLIVTIVWDIGLPTETKHRAYVAKVVNIETCQKIAQSLNAQTAFHGYEKENQWECEKD